MGWGLYPSRALILMLLLGLNTLVCLYLRNHRNVELSGEWDFQGLARGASRISSVGYTGGNGSPS